MQRACVGTMALVLVLGCDPGKVDPKPNAQASAKTPGVEQADGDGSKPGESPSQGAGAKPGEPQADGAKTVEAKADEDAGHDEPPVGKAKLAKVKASVAADVAKAKADRVKLVALLKEGRKLVRAKKHDEGIAKYREALKLDPTDPKVLGELGFAALAKGDLALAESSTRKAIDLSHDPAQQGALYYNLALVQLRQDRKYDARAALEQSLAVRPGNAAVAAKLKTVTVDPKAKGPDKPEAFCAQYMSEWECVGSEAELGELPPDEQEFTGLCECTVKTRIESGGEGFVQAAAHIVLSGNAAMGGEIGSEYIAVKTSGYGWQSLGEFVNGWIPGVMGIQNSGSIETFKFVDLAPTPGEELLIEAKNSFIDTDLGSNTVEFDDDALTFVCFDDGTRGACAKITTASASGIDVLIDGEDVDDGVELTSEGWALTLEFVGGKVRIRKASGELPASIAPLVGERTFAELLAMAEVLKTILH